MARNFYMHRSILIFKIMETKNKAPEKKVDSKKGSAAKKEQPAKNTATGKKTDAKSK
jgi:hypothetical protein